VDSFQTNAGSLLNNYMDSRSASSEKRQRIDLLDLKEQGMGEAHIFFKSKIVRASMFYANPKPPIKMRLNQFLKVEPPIGRLLMDLEDRIIRFNEVTSSDVLFTMPTDEGDEIKVISDSLASQSNANSIEKALGSLLAFHNRHTVVEEEHVVEEEVEEGKLNIFSKVTLTESVKALVGAAQIAKFSEPLISKSTAKDKIELLERLMGRSASQASPMMNEIIKDMSLATEYPPSLDGVLLPGDEVVAIANELCDYVTSLKTKAQEEEI